MTIRELLKAKAAELALHDGHPAVTMMHLHSAAAFLGQELRRDLDDCIVELRADAVPAAAADSASVQS